MFEIQKSGDKTSSGEIGLDIRTHASSEVGQDQMPGGVSVFCWHAAPVAYVLWKPSIKSIKSIVLIVRHKYCSYIQEYNQRFIHWVIYVCKIAAATNSRIVLNLSN